MFNLFKRARSGFSGIEYETNTNMEYHEQKMEERLHILDRLLDDSFEVYYRDSESIMLYNTISGDYIDLNGLGSCNLITFWNNLLVECFVGECSKADVTILNIA